MAEPIRIEVKRYHVDRARHSWARGIHEWCVCVMRGGEALSQPPAYGKDLRECVQRAVTRARAQLHAEQRGMLGWPACGELEACP